MLVVYKVKNTRMNNRALGEINSTHLMPIAAARQYPGNLGFIDSKALLNRSYKNESANY